MSVQLQNLIFDSEYSAFKNNAVFTGSFTISGTVTAGTNLQSISIDLGATTDMVDIVFTGPADVGLVYSDPRPDGAWFKQGAAYVPGTDVPSGYTNYPTQWFLYGTLNGTILTIQASWVQQFTASLALTPTVFYYRLIDYSVF